MKINRLNLKFAEYKLFLKNGLWTKISTFCRDKIRIRHKIPSKYKIAHLLGILGIVIIIVVAYFIFTSGKNESGLVTHFSFDQIKNNIIKDSVNGFKGDVHGAVVSEGRIGKSLYFDGVDDYVQLSNETHKKISKLKNGTISFLFKFESLLDKQSIMPIFYMGMDEEGDKDNILIIEVGHFKQGNLKTQDPDNKRLYSTFIKDNSHPFLCLDSGKSMDENKWTHYALVSDENGTNVYINGQGIEANYNFGKPKDSYFLSDVPNTEVIMIGRGKTSSMATTDFVYFKGYIDDLKIYDRALTPEEIKSIQ
jgi:hypothetical protein